MVVLGPAISLPETLIAGDPVFYLEWTLRSWAKGHRLDAFELASLGKLSRANTRSCTRARNVRRLSRRCVDRQAVRSRRQDARCEDNCTAPFHLVEIGVPSNDRCPPQPLESLDPEPLRRRSRLRALHARRESGRSFGSGSALPKRGTLILRRANKFRGLDSPKSVQATAESEVWRMMALCACKILCSAIWRSGWAGALSDKRDDSSWRRGSADDF